MCHKGVRGSDCRRFEGSRSTYEEHSVEKQFGSKSACSLTRQVLIWSVSKIMVHLFSRIAKLLSATAKLSHTLTEERGFPTVETGAESVSSSAEPDGLVSETPGPTVNALEAEARTLSKDIDCWITSLQLVNLEHERVQVGNRAYAHAMKVGIK